MAFIDKKKVYIFVSLFTVAVVIFLMNMLKIRDGSAIGYAVSESSGEKTSMIVLFTTIGLLLGIIVLFALLQRAEHRY